MEKKDSLKKNYIYNILYQALALIVPLVTTPYVSRILGPENLGDYSYTMSIVTYFNLFGLLGINTYGQIKVAAVRNEPKELSKAFWEINFCRMITMAISIVLFSLVIIFSDQYRMLYLVLTLYLLANMLDITWFFQGLEDFKVSVLRNSIVKLCGLILIFLLVKEKSDIYIYALILQGTVLLGNVVLLPYARKYLEPIEWKSITLWTNWKEAIIYFVPTVATTIYTVLDKSMLEWIVGSSQQNGYYEQAHKIEQILVVALLSIKVVFFPRLVNLFKNGKEEEAKNLVSLGNKVIMFLALPMTLGVVALADYIVPLFLGDEYGPCIRILQIFALLLIVQGMNTYIGFSCLTATGKQKFFNLGVVIGAVTNFVANMFLIKRNAAEGAALASVLAEVVILLIFMYYGREYIKLSDILKSGSKYAVAATLMYGAIVLLKQMTQCTLIMTIGLTMIGACIYVLVLMVMRDMLVMEAMKKTMAIIRKK